MSAAGKGTLVGGAEAIERPCGGSAALAADDLGDPALGAVVAATPRASARSERGAEPEAAATPFEACDDDDLMMRTTRGDARAYADLVARHQGAVRAYCARVCGSRALGDEVAQETFLTIWQARSTYQALGRFKAYLFTVADRRCRDELRRSHRRRGSEPLSAEDPAFQEGICGDQLDGVLACEQSRRVWSSVQKLPENQQQAILLRFTAGLGYEEIGSLLDKPAATVRSQVFLGLTRLRRLLLPGGMS